MQADILGASAIRRMFEEGTRLKAIHGADAVFDFSLGNPSAPPPREVDLKLAELARSSSSDDHRYMNNAGLPAVRDAVAKLLRERSPFEFTASQIVMTCGAAGAINVFLRTVIDPGDEVVLLAPYFSEYPFYIRNHGGATVVCPTTDDFFPSIPAIEKSLTAKTRVVLINTPNNPTGVAYDQTTVDAIGRLCDQHSRKIGRSVYLLMDEPYRAIRYTQKPHPDVFRSTRNAVLVTSHSKDLGLAGERIGWLAIHPEMDGGADLFAGLSVANRVLGFVNAPALMQRLLPFVAGLSVDVDLYRRNRDLFWQGLTEIGYRMPTPEGAFFLFPDVPGGDDVEFCRRLCEDHRILCVPGLTFGAPGRMRISYAVPEKTIVDALPHFRAAFAAK